MLSMMCLCDALRGEACIAVTKALEHVSVLGPEGEWRGEVGSGHSPMPSPTGESGRTGPCANKTIPVVRGRCHCDLRRVTC